MANVPDDWGMYYTRCSACGRRYHESEGGCSCADYLADLDDCHCGERDWDVDGHEHIFCASCGSKPGEVYTECHCCGGTFDPAELEIEIHGGESCAFCELCLYEEVRS